MKKNNLLYDNFEKTLQDGLMKLCKSAGMLEDTLLSSADLDEKWDEFIKDYIADAVREFNDYPEAAVAWPGFIGMALAYYWDKDWEAHRNIGYRDLYGPNGWDDMDEGILHYVLGLELGSEEAIKLAQTMNSCSIATLALIRHEKIEAQTVDGFYILARAYTVMFRIGAAVGLKRLGYNLSPLSQP